MAKKKMTVIKKRMSPVKKKIKKVMHEYKEEKLHSGGKKGPLVKNPKQAIAIALSEAREMKGKKPKKNRSVVVARSLLGY